MKDILTIAAVTAGNIFVANMVNGVSVAVTNKTIVEKATSEEELKKAKRTSTLICTVLTTIASVGMAAATSGMITTNDTCDNTDDTVDTVDDADTTETSSSDNTEESY